MLAKAQTFWPMILTVFTAIGGMGVGGMLKTWLDHKRGTRKDTDDVAMNLVQQLSARLKKVEDSAAQADALCEARMSVLRHRMNNLSTSFDGLLMLIEMAPDKTGEFVTKIKERRVQQEQTEAAERATVNAAILQAGTKGGAA